MALRYLTGIPLDIYKEIAVKHGFYSKENKKFIYDLNCETRKKPTFHYNDQAINGILNEAMNYYNSNSSSSVEITSLRTESDHFTIIVSSDYPLEGPSRTLALFGQQVSTNPNFNPLISGSSIFKYEDLSSNRRNLALKEFEKHQKTMSDYAFMDFFHSRMIEGGVMITAEERKFIKKVKKDLYEYMASPYEYVSQLTS